MSWDFTIYDLIKLLTKSMPQCSSSWVLMIVSPQTVCQSARPGACSPRGREGNWGRFNSCEGRTKKHTHAWRGGQFAQPFLPAVKVGREWVYSRHTPAHEISGISTHCLLFESLFLTGILRSFWCPVVDWMAQLMWSTVVLWLRPAAWKGMPEKLFSGSLR